MVFICTYVNRMIKIGKFEKKLDCFTRYLRKGRGFNSLNEKILPCNSTPHYLVHKRRGFVVTGIQLEVIFLLEIEIIKDL